jgi:glycerol-3-phosphate dehydrogenase (NAD(P)+)
MAGMSFATVGVIGAGAWGTALAGAAARAGRGVILYVRSPQQRTALATTAENPRLPGVPLADGVAVTGDLARAGGCDLVLLATPAQAQRAAAAALAVHLAPGTPVVACAKGIERGSRHFMTEVIAAALPQAVPAILSGPGFAGDVARGLPTAVTLAAHDARLAAALVEALGSATFRPYHTTDVRGVEIGGAIKNVLAIAAGIVAGRRIGASALAALTTRGFAELTRFGRAQGARPETLAGLSGLGDVILSCTSPQSRNFSFGVALGEGRGIAEATGGKLTEGMFTAAVLLDLARAKDIDMPITQAVAAILAGDLSVDAAIEALLARPFRAEGDE